MKHVRAICDDAETDSRGLNENHEHIQALLILAGVDPAEARISEVAFWDNQIIICYEHRITGEFRQVFAGIGNDKKFYLVDERDEEAYAHAYVKYSDLFFTIKNLLPQEEDDHREFLRKLTLF